jgi:hypothetical protein
VFPCIVGLPKVCINAKVTIVALTSFDAVFSSSLLWIMRQEPKKNILVRHCVIYIVSDIHEDRVPLVNLVCISQVFCPGTLVSHDDALHSPAEVLSARQNGRSFVEPANLLVPKSTSSTVLSVIT